MSIRQRRQIAARSCCLITTVLVLMWLLFGCVLCVFLFQFRTHFPPMIQLAKLVESLDTDQHQREYSH